MDEVCTCVRCGNQSWIIGREYVRCSKCSNEYNVRGIVLGGSLVDVTNDETQTRPSPHCKPSIKGKQ